MKTNLSLILRIILGAAVVVLAVLSALPLLPPRSVSADAPAARFSAGRAMADLEVVAREPHGAGSEAQARVRAYILGQVEALGLDPEVETNGAASSILVRLPGTDSTGTVLITGHYDSHPPAPGAGDDGISTVALLESIRVLQAVPDLRNDVLFHFSDAEETGFLGAIGFIKARPQAQAEIGVVLCFDARPGNAPLQLRQTSVGDAWLVRQMTGLPLAMYAGSWTNRGERGEIDCDCSVFDNAGFTTVEIDNEQAGTRYHTPRDTVDAISPDLVQGYGKTMLSLVRHFGSIDLSTRSQGPDLVYYSLPLVGMVAYPLWVMLILSSLGLLAFVGCVILAWRRRIFSPVRFGLSLLGLLVGTVLITLIAQAAWGGVKNSHSVGLAAVNGFEARNVWLAGFIIAAALLMIGLFALLARRLGGVNLAAAALCLYLGIGFLFYFVTDAGNPLATANLAWPFLGGVAGLCVLIFTKQPVWKVVLLALSALVILFVLVPYIWLGSYTLEDAWMPVLVVCTMMVVFVPQVEAIFGGALRREVDKR